MLHIETRGSWREMGRQIGETFREWFPPVLDHFAGWLAADLDKFRPAIGRVRELLLQHCPQLHDETLGMGEGAGIEADLMLGLRFFNELRHYQDVGCSGVFIADGKEGPLLGRTCDIEPDIGAELQMCRISRPDDGPQSVRVTYLPLTGGVGFNEHGLALTGSSATAKVAPGGEGLPMAFINFMMMTRCGTVQEVSRLVSKHQMRGKGAVELACDASGASVMLELVSGRRAIVTPRRADRSWQACSNFCFSKELTNAKGPAYLGNAYIRYGRIVHQVAEGFMERTVAGMKQLLLEIAQPGMVCHAPHCRFKTAYAFVIEVGNRKMHLCPGHPAEAEYMEVSL